ncbi:hypothetical protein M0805_003279 [Coniferiporia weirii]|nr:hypothetical protein M0805_003279 [Coniferiporia weirii]
MSRLPMSRSSSLSSTSSVTICDVGAASTAKSTSKRTRKRFSHEQLIVLEQAYHKTSHPSREERELVAEKTGMDVKSVSIWFQNKRQTERKIALGNATNRNAPVPFAMYPVHYASSESLATHTLDHRTSFSMHHPHTLPAAIPTKSRRPSRTASGSLLLDRIATRAELPARALHTPITKHSQHAQYTGGSAQSESTTVWDAMPSSPLQPESDLAADASIGSPSAREYLDFASSRRGKSRPRGRRTLEWACAAARIAAEKDITTSLDASRPRHFESAFDTGGMTFGSDNRIEDVDTEVESDSHEAITPDNSQTMLAFSPSPIRIFGAAKKSKSGVRKLVGIAKDQHVGDDADVMDAALALCGLLKGRSG